MMQNAVKWLREGRAESNQSPIQLICNDAPGCAIYRVARHSDVLDCICAKL